MSIIVTIIDKHFLVKMFVYSFFEYYSREFESTEFIDWSVLTYISIRF